MHDRRRSPRGSVSEAARIVFNYRHVRNCTVRDISDSGACLDTASTDIPDIFDLIWGQNARTCEIRWRKLNRLGVQFDPFFLLVRSI
jgi:hypothetical protein